MMLFDQISHDIVDAMKAKDKVRLMALRNVKKYFLEAKSAPGAGDGLSDADALKILSKLVKQGRDTASLYKEQGREDLADEELGQVAAIEVYLPKPLTDEELTSGLKDIIGEVGASGPKDMGKVMCVASRRFAGRADGKVISQRVRELLS
ncbi:MAG: GatB/YqeY domain-containing protein [Bacteroidaceae bacterium]|nr:GatB/YqeY domain-containing protein [Bacteroidaceae bacterium]